MKFFKFVWWLLKRAIVELIGTVLAVVFAVPVLILCALIEVCVDLWQQYKREQKQ